MGKHRKPTPAGNTRRQLAIAGLGVVAVGGVLSSQVPAQEHVGSHHPRGGPADIPSILSVGGNAVGARANSPGANPTSTAETVNAAETTPTGDRPDPAASDTGSRARPTESRQESPAPRTTGAARTTQEAPTGSALAMLAHAPKQRQPPQQEQTSGTGAPETQQTKTDHSIPDELAEAHPTTAPQPPTTGDPRSAGLVQHLLGSVSHLDVGGVLGLPARNAPGSGGVQQPPHDR
jgi:hypothetical protein